MRLRHSTALVFATAALFAAARADDPRTVRLTESGGELGSKVQTTEITERNGEIRATITLVGARGGDTTVTRTLTAEAWSRLNRRLDDLDVWGLSDFHRIQRDAIDYTVEIVRGGRAHTVHISGASASPPHLDVVLAIQKAATGGP